MTRLKYTERAFGNEVPSQTCHPSQFPSFAIMHEHPGITLVSTQSTDAHQTQAC